jgi:hypothetical protein
MSFMRIFSKTESCVLLLPNLLLITFNDALYLRGIMYA